MADPTITQIRKAGQARRRTIEQSEKRLRAALRRLQQKLNAFIAKELIPTLKTDKDGNLLKTRNNAARLKANERIRKQLNNVIDKDLRKQLNKEFAHLKNANKKYYKAFKPKGKTQRKATIVARKLQVVFNRSTLNTMSFNVQIGQILSEGISGGVSPKDLRTNLSTFIQGKDKLGALEGHFWKTDGFEQFQVHARAVSEVYANGLNLDYAIYAGGEIKTTRDFCDERNGKVYSRAEILLWNDEEWQGKKKNNRILIDCGGYNCRHEFDWISKQMAVRIRPELGV